MKKPMINVIKPKIQMYMGLRVGETLALNTHDIDLQNQKLNVHRTLTTDEKRKLYNGK